MKKTTWTRSRILVDIIPRENPYILKANLELYTWFEIPIYFNI